MSSPEDLKRLARRQFGPAAEDYVRGSIHSGGAELARMVELARLTGAERVLDVATGGGHTALAFAPHVRDVVACDLTPAMLEAAAAYAGERGAGNIRFEVADAEDLPYQGGEFDVVTVRFAPHHFPDPAGFAEEVARVLRPGGRFLMFDNMVAEDAELDAFMNRFEEWRDPSHFRAHRMSEWEGMLRAAGLEVVEAGTLVRKVYPFDDWTVRMRMPSEAKAALELWLLAAPPRCAEYYRIETAGGRVISLEATFGTIASIRPR